MNKIVLPGGAGLVGQNLVLELLDRGAREVVVIDKHRENMRALKELHPQVTWLEADLAVRGAWEETLAGADGVVLLQAQIGGKRPQEFARNNIDSTRNILAAMRQYGVDYCVHVSSSVVESVADDHYTETKKEQERLVRESGVAHIVLRPTLMFGWFDRKHLGWLARFMRRVPVFPIPGSGRYVRQPLYVGDFCEIIVKCLGGRHTGEPLDITGTERIEYIDMMRKLKRAIGARTAIVRLPYPVFFALLWLWGVIDPDPPFTTAQLKALTAGDEFEVIDWPGMFGVEPTPFERALDRTFNHPVYSGVELSQ